MIDSDIQKLNPGQLVDFFVLDATAIGGDIIRWHSGVNSLGNDVVWQGNTYSRFPVEASGFLRSTKGTLPRPTLRVANVSGLTSALARELDDLVGAKVIRKRTFVRYLDAVNFPDLYKYDFVTGTDGFIAGVATLSASNGVLTWTPTGANPALSRNLSTAERYQGSAATKIKARVRRVSGTGAWEGNCFYSTADHVASTSFRKQISAPADLSAWNELEWDMAALTAGGTDYVSNEIRAIRIDLVSDATSVWEIDYVRVTGTNPSADPNCGFPDEVWSVDRKAAENGLFMEFELASAFDVAGVTLPRRQCIQNVCTWRYRSAECGYAGGPIADRNDQPTSDPAKDDCGKRLASCKLRFGTFAELPFGAFPGVGTVR